MSGQVEAVGYLVIRNTPPRGRHHGGRITSVTVDPPANLPAGSVAVKVRVRLPVSVFAPHIGEATITVPEGAVLHPSVDVVDGPWGGDD